MPNQLEIAGIGQQKITLAMWKNENQIFTHNAGSEEEFPWTCWDEIESALEFGETYSFEAMGFGKTEKEAILNFCEEEKIDPPFWWVN